MSKVIAEKDL